MAERIIVVKEVKDGLTAAGGNSYFQVIDKSGKPYNIFDTALRPIFLDGIAVKLTGEISGKFFNTKTAEKVVNVMEQKAALKVASKMPDNPQELGMWFKVLAEFIIAGKLSELLGKENAVEAVKVFRGQMVSVLKIPFDGKKFPKYE